MKRNQLFIAIALATFTVACSTASENTQEGSKEIPADKEIKMEDVDDQLKSDQERADSIKRELGID